MPLTDHAIIGPMSRALRLASPLVIVSAFFALHAIANAQASEWIGFAIFVVIGIAILAAVLTLMPNDRGE